MVPSYMHPIIQIYTDRNLRSGKVMHMIERDKRYWKSDGYAAEVK